MDVGETRQARQLLVEARVVLHRARAERIQPAVDRIILLRKPSEMAHYLRLAETRKTDRSLPFYTAEAVLERLWFRQVDAAIPRRILLKKQRLFELQPAIAGQRLDRLVEMVYQAGAYRRT